MERIPTMNSLEWKEAMKMCTDSGQAACREIPSLLDVDAKDLERSRHTPEETNSIALTTIEIVVRTLQSCLPATTMISRQYSMQSEVRQASDVTRLLDISMNLIDPVRKAFSQIPVLYTPKFLMKDQGKDSKDDQAQDKTKDAASVDFESISRVFDEQAKALQDWKTKHKSDFELELANSSPAKLASIADSIQNIMAILCEYMQWW
jgi:hypothetical protein